MAKRKIILDTDIADDIDDAIALSFALGSPEFDLLGVTVVYGDVETRAKVARKLIRAWGRDVPVKLGAARPLDFDWFPGTVPEQCSQRLAVANEPPLDDDARCAASFIAQTVRRHPGEVTLVTIGAMTNVAAALILDPELVKLVPEVVTVTGGVPPFFPGLDWNCAYDVSAAEVIARSGVNWTVIGADVHRGNSLQREEFDALAASGLPAAEALLELVVLMKRHKLGQDASVRTIRDVQSASTCDVMGLAYMLVPERMNLQRGRTSVNRQMGCLNHRPDVAGPHRWAGSRLEPDSYRGEILRRLLTAPPASGPAIDH